MKAHQRIIREQMAEAPTLLGNWWDEVDTSLDKATVAPITSEKAAQVILEYEWLGTMPQLVTRCFGFFHDGILAGACVFAEKPGGNLTSNQNSVVPSDSLYLARGACVHWAHPHAASWFIAHVCRALSPCSVLAYSDPEAGEIGTIYQALNWFYIGPSSGGHTGVWIDGKRINLHSFKRDRDYSVGQGLDEVRKAFPSAKSIIPIPRKGRYVGVYGPRPYRKPIEKALRAVALPYPKREVPR